MCGRGVNRLGDVMHVAALEMELHIPTSNSLKAKRAVVRHIVETARRRYGVAASEVDHHDVWQRAGLGFSAVAPTRHTPNTFSMPWSVSCGRIRR